MAPDFLSQLDKVPICTITFNAKAWKSPDVNPKSIETLEEWIGSTLNAISTPTAAATNGDTQSPTLHVIVVNNMKNEEINGLSWDQWKLRLRRKMGLCDRPGPVRSVWCRRGPDQPGGAASTEQLWKYSVTLPVSSWVFSPPSQTTVALLGILSESDHEQVKGVLTGIPNLSPALFINPFAWPMLLLDIRSGTSVDASSKNHKAVNKARRMANIQEIDHNDIPKQTILPPAKELMSLTRDILRTTQEISGQAKKMLGFARLAGFLRDENRRFVDSRRPVPGDIDAVADFIDENLRSLQELYMGLHEEAQVQQWDSDMVLQGLQAIIARWDHALTTEMTNQSITIAKESKRTADESQQIAKESKLIAKDSWRDTTSMTAITIITMVFLPGTFTSTLFSIPWFQEVVGSGNRTYQWKLYVGLTATLTILVISTWYVWSQYRRDRQSKGRDKAAVRATQV